MAETAGNIIRDALNEIVVLGAEAPLEAEDAQSAIRYYNRMMDSLNAEGIDLGNTTVTSTADVLTIPDGAIEAAISMLALRLWTQYSDGQPPPGELIAKAAQGKEIMRKLTFVMGPAFYGDTLPIGSGNENVIGFNDSHFYPDQQSEVLTETNGTVGLESGTE